jgi:hypothetical protein
MLPDPLPFAAADTGTGKSVARRSIAASVSPIALISGLAPTSVTRVSFVTWKGAPPPSDKDAGKGMIRGGRAPDRGPGGAAAGGLQADTSSAHAIPIASFGRDHSSRADMRRLLSLGVRFSQVQYLFLHITATRSAAR